MTTKAKGGPIAWMTDNKVAANLALIVLAAAGALGLWSVKQEVFPEFTVGLVVVSVPYPGASPGDVEQGVLLAVEEAVSGIDGVKRVSASATEGLGMVYVELLTEADETTAVADISAAVERISTLPEQAEEPTVALASTRREVVSLVISGDYELTELHELAEQARSRLLREEEISLVEIKGLPPVEVAVEVPRQQLEALDLTLEDISRQIAAASIELPGGSIETRGGEVLVRVDDRRRWGHELADVAIRSTVQGSTVTLGEIATIRDGYSETDQASFFDGERALRLSIFRVGEETPTTVAQAVRRCRDAMAAELPEGVTLSVWSDSSEILQARIELLLRNAWMGFLLVLLVLALFLKPRLAAWIALGIPVSFLGAFALMPALDLSINMITLLALIITLGLVVDDAIVVGENVYHLRENGLGHREAAIEGARQMALPVTFAVLTTVAAFSPMFFVPGVMGKVFWSIPAVVCAVLVFSLLECFFVLPAHLSHRGDESKHSRLERLSQRVKAGLSWFTERWFAPLVRWSLAWRYATVAVGLVCLGLALSVTLSGRLPFNFFPRMAGNTVTASARLPYGAATAHTQEIRTRLEAAALEAVARQGDTVQMRGMLTRVGEGAGNHLRPPEVGGHLVTVELDLNEGADADAVAAAWNQAMAGVPGLESLTTSAAFGPGAGAAVDVQLSHRDGDQLARASEELAESLRRHRDLVNIENTWAAGKEQIDFHMLPSGHLGLTGNDVARQLRSAFFGAEALREQRGRQEVKVMVRLPREQRQGQEDLDQFLLRTPRGGQVPLGQVATFSRSRGPTVIDREDGQRRVNVRADLAATAASSRDALTALHREVLPALEERYPGLEVSFAGEQREQQEVFSALGQGSAVALVVMFALLAIPLRSYAQPLLIMAAIPFGFVGAVAGHLLMGYELSVFSVLGVVALSGVVVNDSLLLITATNDARSRGLSATEAVTAGVLRRFRPIFLTSLTTFVGLMPMVLETSPQARLLVPMALSLGFGILFATFVVLLLVPCLYLMVDDVRQVAVPVGLSSPGQNDYLSTHERFVQTEGS
jgi:multidrug efflux pump subunit AcrB